MDGNGQPPPSAAPIDHEAAARSAIVHPRDMADVSETAVAEARLLAEDYYWEWEVKERRSDEPRAKLLCGISIDGALSLTRAWRNCRYVPTVECETDDYWRFLVSFIDYETNTTTSRLYVQPKRKPPAGFDPERWEARQFQNGQSRAIRIAIEKSLPTWLVKRGIEAAKEAAVEALSSEKTLKSQREEIISRAKDLGITSTQLKSKAGKSVSAYKPEDVVTIRALLNAIEDGEATIEQMFGKATGTRGRKAKPKDAPKDAPKPDTAKKDASRERGQGKPDKAPDKPQPSLVEKFGRDLKNAKDEQELEFVTTDIEEASVAGKLSKGEHAELQELTEQAIKRLRAPAKAS